jgi:hypothetical protein
MWRRATLVTAAYLTVASASTVAATAAGSARPAPYTDSSAVGYIGLCNEAGQQVTSGSVSAAPFVWRAVSSQAAPAPYNGPGGTAILDAYLPMQSLPAGDWSGEQLTASARYSNPQSPMAQATAQDVPLEDFLQDYPPEWDGFVQLRLYLGTQNQPANVQHYPALDLQISGNTWTAVGGGHVNCNVGSAESLETVLAPSSTTTTVATSAVAANGAATTKSTSAAGEKSRSATADPASTGIKSGDTDGVATTQPQSGSRSGPLSILLFVVVAIALALSVLLVVRRRRAHRLSSIANRSSVKGPQL